MIKLKKWQYVLAGTVAALALWTFVGVGTSLFTTDGVFEYFTYISSYILVLCFWGLAVLEFNISEKLKRNVGIALFALTPFFCMQISMMLAGKPEYSFLIFFINMMFYASFAAVVLAATRSFRASAIAAVGASYLFNLACFVINILRGTPLIPGDILAIGTAAQVAQHYTFEMRYPIIAATVTVVTVIALLVKFPYKPKFRLKNVILPASGVLFAAIFIAAISFQDYSEIDMDFFDQYHANNTHGTAYSFYINARRMTLERPDGYDSGKAETLLAEDGAPFPADADKPNIIVIMNESFADLKSIGDFKTSEDYMPFTRELTNNAIKGELLVSPFGGYTCNTEFEFLTGLSMGLLPSGATPYLQYISKPFPSALPEYLSENGYKSVALHPYYARCWNRKTVYRNLGFDEFVSMENMSEFVPEDEWEYVRYYLSDRTSYRTIEKCLENKEKDKPLFLFNVTMQNHGGYTYDGAEFPTVTITDMQGSYAETEQYLSLIKESDSAFEEFIMNMKNYGEKTIVVMFGDHQPAVEQAFFEELYGRPLLDISAEELQRRYTVPFVIWANYDVKEQTGIKTSPNYLSDLVLDTAGLPKSATGNFTSRLSKEIPQINVMGHYDAGGVWHENDVNESDGLRDYNYIEYYQLTNK